MSLCHLSVPAVTRNASKLEPACRSRLPLPHVPSLGSLRRRVVVVSYIELVVSDGELARIHLSPMQCTKYLLLKLY
jgi:hypothetical protein